MDKKFLPNLLMMAVMVLSLPLTIGLVQTQHSFRSRAAGEEIQFVGPNVEYQNGRLVAKGSQIAVQLASPFGPPPGVQISGETGFLPWGSVGVVYGQGEGDGDESVYIPPAPEAPAEEAPEEEAPAEEVIEEALIDNEGQGGVVEELITEGTCDDCESGRPALVEEEQPIDVPSEQFVLVNIINRNGEAGVQAVPPGNKYGEYYLRDAPLRPYHFIPYEQLDEGQREAVAKWEKSPYNLVWTYTTEPGSDNDWAGWGPPPPGWTARSEIPRTPEGAFMGGGLPWPPPGEPRGGWLPEGDPRRDPNYRPEHSTLDPLYRTILTPEEAEALVDGRLTADDVRSVSQDSQALLDLPIFAQGTEQTKVTKKPTVSRSNRQTTQNRSTIPSRALVASIPGVNPDFCTTNPTDAFCTGGAKNSCEGYYQASENGRGLQWCNPGVLVDGVCRRDPAVTRTCVDETSGGGTAVAAKPAVAGASATTVSFKIAENPADLVNADVRTYTEPLLLTYEFGNNTPGEKFLFVEFTDSTGKKGGCGPDQEQACIASITLSGTPEISECTPEIKARANIRRDSSVNDFDALQLRQILASIAAGQNTTGGDVNQDGVINAEDYSLLLSCFGSI